MYCPKCGNEIKKGDLFCAKCAITVDLNKNQTEDKKSNNFANKLNSIQGLVKKLSSKKKENHYHNIYYNSFMYSSRATF